MDEFKGLGKPTEWADRAVTPKAEPEVGPTVKPEPKVEMPKPPKLETAPASDMHALASLMKKKLTSVNISVDSTKFPYVSFEDDFGDCGLRFGDTGQIEVKIHCHVEKGFDSVGRLLEITQTAEKTLRGQCSLNGHTLKTHYIKHYTHSGGGLRHATLYMGVTMSRK